jgi:hypothetical protein
MRWDMVLPLSQVSIPWLQMEAAKILFQIREICLALIRAAIVFITNWVVE